MCTSLTYHSSHMPPRRKRGREDDKAGFEPGGGNEEEGREGGATKGKMPEGRVGKASWNHDGKHSCGSDSGPDTALMASCSTIHSKHGREGLLLSSLHR